MVVRGGIFCGAESAEFSHIHQGHAVRTDGASTRRIDRTIKKREKNMIVEERVYTLKVGKVMEHFRIYEKTGLELQKRILGNLVGYYQAETGTLNQIVHLWAYEDMNDRAARRAELFSNPDWLRYIAETGGLVERQENRILTPAPFFERSLRAMLAVIRPLDRK